MWVPVASLMVVAHEVPVRYSETVLRPAGLGNEVTDALRRGFVAVAAGTSSYAELRELAGAVAPPAKPKS